jgi:hypothetical protein
MVHRSQEFSRRNRPQTTKSPYMLRKPMEKSKWKQDPAAHLMTAGKLEGLFGEIRVICREHAGNTSSFCLGLCLLQKDKWHVEQRPDRIPWDGLATDWSSQ